MKHKNIITKTEIEIFRNRAKILYNLIILHATEIKKKKTLSHKYSKIS